MTVRDEPQLPAYTSQGPPWILGQRGAPLEAPENTLAGFEHALALGLDGVAYDVRACASGDLVLMADAYVDRTTDLCGLLSQTSSRQLASADAGVHFGRKFSGERVPYLSEALGCGAGAAGGPRALHLVFAPEPQTVDEIAAQLAEHGSRLSVRVASDELETCRRAHDLGLSVLWLAPQLDERTLRRAAQERFAAVGAPLAAWRAAPRGAWPCERVALRCDSPKDLLDAVREPFHSLVTSEPRRALALRELVALAPRALARPPLEVDALEVDAGNTLGGEGEWCGRWRPRVRLFNPFDAPLHARFELAVRRGAFECGALPEELELEPGAAQEFDFELAGGSWSPGADPLLLARLAWGGRELTLDAPLERVRSVVLRDAATRLRLLRENPGDPPASVTIRRHRRDLLAALETPGDLDGARVVVRLGDQVVFGAAGVRLVLPDDFDALRSGLPFSIGILGARHTPRGRRRVLRRWAGGLPDVAPSGVPGRLRSDGRG
jgi:hypothetical protein